MAECFMLKSRPRDLWREIEKQHLTYLQTEESPEKFQSRKKLEGVIKEYLCLVPHSQKFRSYETEKVLHQSAAKNEDFNGYSAASAWNCLALYASNLLSHPWRKEYREIELYSGYFKHEVQGGLLDSDLMLQEMGYKHIGDMTMVMEWPLDPDRVASVSLDSLVAFVECRVLQKIWESLTSHFPCSWLEVVEYRETHVGTWDQAVQGIMYRYRQRQFEEQHQAAMQDVYATGRFCTQPAPCMYGQVAPVPHMNYCTYAPFALGPSHGYNAHVQARYSAPMVPQPAMQPVVYPAVHPSYLPQTVIKPQEMYPTNGHHPYNFSNAYVPTQVPVQNGYHPTSNHVQPTCSVPTGQLIELDPATPPASSNSDNRPGISATDSSSMLNPTKSSRLKPKEKTKDDGTGTFGNWDYVYRNLESQGYSKDLGERPDVLTPPYRASATLPNPNKTQKKTPASDLGLEEALMQMRLEECQRKAMLNPIESKPLKFDEALHKIRLEGDGEPARAIKRNGDGDSLYDNMSSPPKEKPVVEAPKKSTATKTLPRDLSNRHSDRVVSNYSSGTLGSTKRVAKPDEGIPWECITCTYRNRQPVEVCEMCGKSKNRGSESKPLTTGGQECPQCTLVNERGITMCEACGCNLEHSPTYI